MCRAPEFQLCHNACYPKSLGRAEHTCLECSCDVSRRARGCDQRFDAISNDENFSVATANHACGLRSNGLALVKQRIVVLARTARLGDFQLNTCLLIEAPFSASGKQGIRHPLQITEIARHLSHMTRIPHSHVRLLT